MAKRTDGVLAAYAQHLKAWPKAAGAKPTVAAFDIAHNVVGCRVGTLAGLANAMYARPGGATAGQVAMVTGGQHLNKMRAAVTRKAVERVDLPQNAAGHTVYHIKPAKAAKAKAGKAAKPRKAKAAKPAQPAATATGEGS